jgi:hypothetical protein
MATESIPFAPKSEAPDISLELARELLLAPLTMIHLESEPTPKSAHNLGIDFSGQLPYFYPSHLQSKKLVLESL